MNKIILSTALLFCVLIGLGCKPSAGTLTPEASEPTTIVVAETLQPTVVSKSAKNPRWEKNLRLWLAIGYVEQEHQAAFASVPLDIVTKPNLYATYSVLGIYTALDEPIKNRDAIAEWLESLMTQSGSFQNDGPYPRLQATLWAVRAMKMLGHTPRHPDKILSYLFSLQDETGWFRFDDNTGQAKEKLDLSPTIQAVEAIRDLGMEPKTVPALNKTREALIAYLRDHPYSKSQTANDPNTGEAGQAALALALLDPTAVPDEFRSSIQRELATVSLSADLMSILKAKGTLDKAQLLGLPIPESTSNNLRRVLNESVLPALPTGGSDSSGTLDLSSPTPKQKNSVYGSVEPMTTSIILSLAQKVGASFPNKRELLQTIALHQLASGWSMFGDPQTNPAATYSALKIAREIRYKGYTPDKVAAYLLGFVQPDDSSFDLQSAYYAVRGLLLLGHKPDDSILQALKGRAVARINSLPEDQRDGELLYMALLAQSMKWDWPNSLKEPARLALQSQNDLGLGRMLSIHFVTVLQAASGIEVVPREQLVEKVIALSTAEGGFKAVEQSPVPDLLSTYQAVRILEILSAKDKVDKDKLRQFISSSQGNYGFNLVPLALVKQHPDMLTPGATQATLFSTAWGFEILEGLEQ